MTDEYRRDDATGLQLFGNIARQAPILGGLTRGFDELRLAVNGQRASMDADIATAKASEEVWLYRQKVMADGRDTVREYAKSLGDLNDEYTLLKTPDLFKGAVTADLGLGNRLAGLRQDMLVKSGITTDKGEDGPLVEMQRQFDQAKADRDRKAAAFRDATKAKNAEFKARDNSYSPAFYELEGKETAAGKAYGTSASTVSDLAIKLATLKATAADVNKAYTVNRDAMIRNGAKLIDDEYDGIGRKLADTFNESNKPLRTFYDGWGDMVKKSRDLNARAMDDFRKDTETLGRAMHDSLRTPGEVVRDDVAELKRLFDAGGINGEDLTRGLSKARDALLEVTAPNAVRLQAEDTSRGHSMVTAQDQGGREKIELDQLDTQKELLKQIETLVQVTQSGKQTVTVVSMPGGL